MQSSNWPYVVLKLPKLRARLGQLQATSSMFVVQWWPYAQGLPWENEYRIYAELLQLRPSRSTETSSSVISRLQPSERELQRRRKQRVSKGSSGRKFFSTFTSPEQSYATALRQDSQQWQTHAPQTYAPPPCSSSCQNRRLRPYTLPVGLTMTC
jgi:hypothetical protein